MYLSIEQVKNRYLPTCTKFSFVERVILVFGAIVGRGVVGSVFGRNVGWRVVGSTVVGSVFCATAKVNTKRHNPNDVQFMIKQLLNSIFSLLEKQKLNVQTKKK